jgi:hypothetical protein
MKNSLEHLPKHKRDELERAVSVIREMCDDVEMIILFQGPCTTLSQQV